MPVEFEEDLGDALRRTADTFRPDDPGALVGAGHLRGRRLRRRRTATVVAGAAAIAAVAVVGVQAGGLAQGGGHSGGVAAAPEQPKPEPPAKPATAPPVSGAKVAAIFGHLLPSGTVTGLKGTGTQGHPYASATAVFDNGPGAGLVQVDLQRDGGVPGSCPPVAQNPGTWCSITHVQGGTLMLFKGYEYPDHRGNVKDWTAMFVTSDGAGIAFSQWNSSSEKGAPTTRTDPPLDVAEMTAMVTSDAWKPVLAALPHSTRHGVPPTDLKVVGGVPPTDLKVVGRKG